MDFGDSKYPTPKTPRVSSSTVPLTGMGSLCSLFIQVGQLSTASCKLAGQPCHLPLEHAKIVCSEKADGWVDGPMDGETCEWMMGGEMGGYIDDK